MARTKSADFSDDLTLDEVVEGAAIAAPEATVKVSSSVTKSKAAMDKAAATASLEAAIKSNSVIAQRDAERIYIQEKKADMLKKCKSDKVVSFVGQKIFANYFGPTYSFLYNTIPVTVKFDGSEQKFPKFIYDFLMKKINAVSESNTNKETTYQL